MVDPDRPDFTGCYRDWALPLHFLDERNELGDGHLGAQRGLVADDDRVDVAVVAGKIECRLYFALVSSLVLVDPGADRDLKAEFGRDRRHQFGASGRRIKADGSGIGSDGLEIGSDLFGCGPVAAVGMGRVDERSVRNAGKLAGEIRRFGFRTQESPQAGMHARYEREHGSDGAHRLLNHAGRGNTGPNPSPRFDVGRKAMRLPCERQTNK